LVVAAFAERRASYHLNTSHREKLSTINPSYLLIKKDFAAADTLTNTIQVGRSIRKGQGHIHFARNATTTPEAGTVGLT
jgi:hypothetical protein